MAQLVAQSLIARVRIHLKSSRFAVFARGHEPRLLSQLVSNSSEAHSPSSVSLRLEIRVGVWAFVVETTFRQGGRHEQGYGNLLPTQSEFADVLSAGNFPAIDIKVGRVDVGAWQAVAGGPLPV